MRSKAKGACLVEFIFFRFVEIGPKLVENVYQ